MGILRQCLVAINLIIASIALVYAGCYYHWICGSGVFIGIITALLFLGELEFIPLEWSRILKLPPWNRLGFTVSAMSQRISLAGLIGIPVLLFIWPVAQHIIPKFSTLGFPSQLRYAYFASWLLSLAALIYAFANQPARRLLLSVSAIARASILYLIMLGAFLVGCVMFINARAVFEFHVDPEQISLWEKPETGMWRFLFQN